MSMADIEGTGSIPLLTMETIEATVDRPTGVIDLQYTGLNQSAFDEKYDRVSPEKVTPKSFLHEVRQKWHCSRDCLTSSLKKYIPVIDLLTTYRFKEYVLGDLVGGISTAVLVIPQSMGYSLLANLPPIIGLYTSFFPVLVYFIFGRSRHNSVGTMALSSLIIASSVSKGLTRFVQDNVDVVNSTIGSENSTNVYSQSHQQNLLDEDLNSPVSQEKIRIAMMVSLISGIFLLIMGTFKLGIFASYISDPFIGGFIAACNIHVLTHQVKHLLGIHVGSHTGPLSYFYTLRDIVLGIKHTNIATLVTSIIAITVLILVKKLVNERYADKLKVPVPIDFIVVILATIVSHFSQFEMRFGVKIIKVIPQGLPTPTVPSMENGGMYVMDGIILGLLNFVLMFMMIKMFADKHNYPYDANQELLAAGLCATSGVFFSSMAAGTSPPRCILSEQTGGRTQVTQLVSALIVLLTLLFIAPLFESLPRCILGSLIVVACIPLFRYYLAFVEYWKTSKMDLAVMGVTFVSTIFVGIDVGIVTGMAFSTVSVVLRTQQPYTTQLTRVPEDNVLLNASKYDRKVSVDLDGLIILRFEAPLYFATTDLFKCKIFTAAAKPADLIERSSTRMKQSGDNREMHRQETKVGDSSNENPDIKSTEAHLHTPLTSSRIEHECNDPSAVSHDLKVLIVDCCAMSFVDTMGAKMLAHLRREYSKAGVRFLLANVSETARDTLHRTEACGDIVKSGIYPTVYDAVVDSRTYRGSLPGIGDCTVDLVLQRPCLNRTR